MPGRIHLVPIHAITIMYVAYHRHRALSCYLRRSNRVGKVQGGRVQGPPRFRQNIENNVPPVTVGETFNIYVNCTTMRLLAGLRQEALPQTS